VEFHLAFDSCKDGVILAHANALARPHLGAALTHDDVPRKNGFATELLHAKATACAVATVTGGTACFFYVP